MNVRVTNAVLSIALLVGVTSTHAQQEGRAFKLGEADVFPAVEIEYVSDSNAFLDADDEIDATGVIVSPELVWRADRRLLNLTAGYNGEYGLYSEDALDYDDHVLFFTADSELTARNRLGFDFSLRRNHEDLGTDETRGRGIEFSESGETSEETIVSVGSDYTFGASSARGNVTAGLLVQSTSYSVTRDPQTGVDVNDGDEFTRIRPFGIFSLRVSPDTRLLAEFRYAVLDFGNDNRDRSETSLLGGVEFRGTGKLGGSAKIGGTLATFDAESVEDQTELTADINVFYLPRTYSRLSLTFSREFDDQNDSAAGELDIVQATRDVGSVRWRHEWSSRFNTLAFAALSNLDRECLNDQLTTTAGLEFNITPRRWIAFGLSGTTRSRAGTSNDCAEEVLAEDELDYEQQVLGAHVRVTL